ncbi:cache domain-containing sensor histidine kinase [Paenibacillus hamazuiensis]|uniref:cache domain-containing sensor histidine kinase n=1 Tax=Paenibacillus hamazuiensis TaxID=2936508 RepID=UPI00200CD137|nr:sensor histidine kinase [Paenibacillus hamazuiensis]
MIRNSIRGKLILFLLGATILPIVSSIVITYYFTKQNVSQETIRSNSNLIYQGKTNIVTYLNIIEQTSLAVYKDQDLYSILETGGSDDFMVKNEVYRALQSISNSVRDIHQIYLYIAAAGRSHLFVHGQPGRNAPPDPAFIPNVHKGGVSLEPTHISHSYGVGSSFYVPPSVVVSMHRSIFNVVTQRELGTLSIDINIEVIRSICEQLYDRNQEELYILDRSGRVIYGPDPSVWGKPLPKMWVPYLLEMTESNGTFEWNKPEFQGVHIFERMQTPYMDWVLVKSIPNEVLYHNAREVTQLNSTVFVIFLGLVIGATLYISFRFTQPIKNLLRYISQIQSGNMQVDIKVTSNDEIGILARRFRQMMQTINNLIMREYKLDIANKTNQLKALQAQINPHFLYNSLQSIGTLALQHDAPKIYSLLSSLAKMMRYSMNTNETLVPLKFEIDHVKSYLQLQMQRFENELSVTFDIDPQTLSTEVPKMILQPLVENYFKHGFDPREKTGELKIASSFADEAFLQITVEDNGRGMEPEQLEDLQNRLMRDEYPGEAVSGSIGLVNVKSRLALYYEGQSRIELERREPSGLKVTLAIPLSREEDMQ